MNPLLVAQLRRHWGLVGAVLVLALFMASHVVVFRPAVSRYQAALRSATALGTEIDPAQAPRMMPPRVLALVSNNAVAAAQGTGAASELTSALIDDVTRITGEHGMVTLATEPGATLQQPRFVQVRAHLRLRGSYGGFAGFLDALTRGGSLIAVDRFSLIAVAPGRHVLDLYVSRYVLKQTGGNP